MFDLGWPEFLVIAIVLIVVVGPKDLPRMLRTFGRTTSKLRSMAGDFRKQFDDAIAEADLDDVKNTVNEARKLDPRGEIRKHLNPIEKAGQDIRSGLDAAMKPKPDDSGTPASGEARPAAPAKAGATAAAGDGKASGGKGAAAKTASGAAATGKAATGKDASKKPATKKPAAKKPAQAKTAGAATRRKSTAAKPAAGDGAAKKRQSATNKAATPAGGKTATGKTSSGGQGGTAKRAAAKKKSGAAS